MEKVNNGFVTKSQLTFSLIGPMIGIGVLSLPNGVVKYSKQSGWICVILGAIYPLYMVLIANYMCKNYPNDNILVLSKKYLGKFLGNILNFIFFIQFLIYSCSLADGVANMINTMIAFFIPPKVLILLIILVSVYTCFQGMKTISRLNEVIFFATIAIYFLPLIGIKKGEITNFLPVLNTSVGGIIKGTSQTLYSYAGIEYIFLLYPLMINKMDLKKAGLKAVAIAGCIYLWFTVLTIYMFGVCLIPKFQWSLIGVMEVIKTDVLNNFIYVFSFFWFPIMFKTSTNNYQILSVTLNDLTKINIKIIYVVIAPIIFYISLKFGNETMRVSMANLILPIMVTYNIMYATVIALLIRLKKVKKT